MGAIERTEAVEAALDAFISHRAHQNQAEREREEMYEASVKRDRERRQEANRLAWSEYERHLERVHKDLALEHRARAEALAEEEAV